MLERGWLIVFEGIDGTGKSTQCRLMETRLEERGVPVVRLREPTDGVWGQKIRTVLVEGRDGVTPEEELSWFIEDRREDVEKNILPAIKERKVILLDRYYYSTAAYQGALGLDPEGIRRDNEAFAPVPDRTYIFIAPPELCLKRIEKSREGHSSFEKQEYLVQVQNIFKSFQGPHIRKIDGLQPVNNIHEQLCRDIDEMIGL
ncbi:thymidylate kinase [Candidatus Nitromaritima sp. SCGC AAA799-C22]|nr:thymidylate kinase [Candidatus Nitromaritima sp. SCGC AAA799-C22]